MASMGVLEQAWKPSAVYAEEKSAAHSASARDVKSSQLLLDLMKETLKKCVPVPQSSKSTRPTAEGQDYNALVKRMENQNVWTPAVGDGFAKFGNELHISVHSHRRSLGGHLRSVTVTFRRGVSSG